MKQIRVKSVSHLETLIHAGKSDYYILLNYNLISRKKVGRTKNGRFRIYNWIDGTEQIHTESELFSESNIGEAIRKGAFIAE